MALFEAAGEGFAAEVLGFFRCVVELEIAYCRFGRITPAVRKITISSDRHSKLPISDHFGLNAH